MCINDLLGEGLRISGPVRVCRHGATLYEGVADWCFAAIDYDWAEDEVSSIHAEDGVLVIEL